MPLPKGLTLCDQFDYFFLAKGKNLDKSKFKNIDSDFKDPEGPEVIVTPNVHVTNYSWLEIGPML